MQGCQYVSSVQVGSTSLLRGNIFFISKLNNIHEYLNQHSLKSGGIKDHIIVKQVKVPGISPLILKGLHMNHGLHFFVLQIYM